MRAKEKKWLQIAWRVCDGDDKLLLNCSQASFSLRYSFTIHCHIFYVHSFCFIASFAHLNRF